MPQISQITKQKKRERFNIFTDDRFAFSVSNFSLLENKLAVGKILTQENIDRIVSKEQLGTLTDLAVRFLTLRPRSEKEVLDYVAKKIAQKNEIKFNVASQSPLIPKVIAKLKRYQYINDLDFASWLVKSRLKSSSPRSLRFIILELKKKGISADLIEKATRVTPSEDKQATKALSKKSESWLKLPELEFKKKAYSYLSSRGFSYDSIAAAVAFYLKKR